MAERYKQPNFKHPWKSSRGGICWECNIDAGEHTLTGKVEKRLMGWLLSVMIDNEITDDLNDDDRLNVLHDHWDTAKLVGEEVIGELLAELSAPVETPAPVAAQGTPQPRIKAGEFHDTQIDREFQALIPPLTPDELDGLEASLIEDGCRDDLIVWKETGILLDGHNRREICLRLGIPWGIDEKSFPDRDHAKQWIMRHQLSRRNLSESQRALLASMVWKRVPGNTTGDRDESGLFAKNPSQIQMCKFAQLDSASPQGAENANTAPIITGTRKAISDTHGVSERTLGYARKVTNHGVQELRDAVMQGEVAVSAAAAVADLPEAQQRTVLAGGAQAVKDAARQAREAAKPAVPAAPAPPVAPAPPAVQPAPLAPATPAIPYANPAFGDDDEDEPGLLNCSADVVEDCDRVVREAQELLNLHEGTDHLIILTGMMMITEAWGRLENEANHTKMRANVARFLDRYGNPGATAMYLASEDDGEDEDTEIV